MRKTKLKPCPFCGGVPHVEIDNDFWGIKHYKVACPNEGCEGQPTTTWNVSLKEAINIWNRRATDERAD